MSTRYVWETESLGYEEKTRTVTITNGQIVSGTTSAYTMGYVVLSVAPIEDSSKNLKGWMPGPSPQALTGGSFEVASAPNFNEVGYFIPEDSNLVTRYAEPKDKTILSYWFGTINYETSGGITQGAATLHASNVVSDNMDSQRLQIIEHYLDKAITRVSSNDRNAYTGSDYAYLGSDSIDPLSISYPTSGVNPGDSITVTVNPGTNTYGGTISYLYQYNTGSGWVTIQTTTATSIQFNIPGDASSIQFRVRAQDNWGFTSDDYVTGPTVYFSGGGAVSGRVWIGAINGTARQATGIWVGVNGVAKKVTAMWVGVNGIAKKVF